VTTILSRMWRWLTLADAPVNRTKPQCFACEQPATCLSIVTFNGRTESNQVCPDHVGLSLTQRRWP
jgi:hypothetical protein